MNQLAPITASYAPALITATGARATPNALIDCVRRRDTYPEGAHGGPITLAHSVLKLLYDGSKRATSGKGPSAPAGERGQGADSPAEIPTKGWKDIVTRVYRGIGDDRITSIAAGVTFFTLLALFPGIAGLIAVYGLSMIFAPPRADEFPH